MIIDVNQIIWNENNIAHIARHKVARAEVEQILHGDFIVRNSYRERLIFIGLTETGRILTIITHEDEEGKFYIVTARDSNFEEKEDYQKERGEAHE